MLAATPTMADSIDADGGEPRAAGQGLDWSEWPGGLSWYLGTRLPWNDTEQRRRPLATWCMLPNIGASWMQKEILTMPVTFYRSLPARTAANGPHQGLLMVRGRLATVDLSSNYGALPATTGAALGTHGQRLRIRGGRDIVITLPELLDS